MKAANFVEPTRHRRQYKYYDTPVFGRRREGRHFTDLIPGSPKPCRRTPSAAAWQAVTLT